jgi:hypothetical protein
MAWYLVLKIKQRSLLWKYFVMTGVKKNEIKRGGFYVWRMDCLKKEGTMLLVYIGEGGL